MKYFFLLIFYTSSVFATQDILSSLDFLNKFNLNGNRPQINSCSITNTTQVYYDTNELNNRCAIDLCGIPNNTKTSALLNSNFDQYVQKNAMDRFQEVESKIIEVIEAEFKKNSDFLKALEDKVKTDANLLSDFNNLEDWEYETYSRELFDKYINFEVDKTKRLINYKIELPINSSDLLKSGVKQYAESRKVKMLSSNLPKASCSGDACKKAVQEQLEKQDLNDLISKLKKRNQEREKRIKERITYCKSELAINSLREYKKDDFKKLIPEIKKNFLKNVFNSYSSDSTKAFKNYLENDLHLSAGIIKQDVQQYIDNVNDSYKSFKKNSLPENFTSYDNKKFIKTLLDYKNYLGEIDPLNSITICKDSLSFVAWDQYFSKNDASYFSDEEDIVTDKDNIMMSAFTCNNHAHGKGILAHEMGHALSSVFSTNRLSRDSYEKYRELRQCASTLYKYKEEDENQFYIFEHEGDNFKTEEDTADLISYMANPDKTALYGCSLLEPSTEETHYVKLDLSNSEIMDTHSSPLLRLLQEAIHKRISLPSTCQELINQNVDKFRFTSCF